MIEEDDIFESENEQEEQKPQKKIEPQMGQSDAVTTTARAAELPQQSATRKEPSRHAKVYDRSTV